MTACCDQEMLVRQTLIICCYNNLFPWIGSRDPGFELQIDAPPPEHELTHLMHRIGQAAKDSAIVEVPFQSVAPTEDQYWSNQTLDDVRVPVGRAGAVRLQHLRLGRGVAQHALIAGKTGSGKSTTGAKLARKIGYDFVDMDHLIEETAGMTIPGIFSEHGEEVFRKWEQDILLELCEREKVIVSTGGGAPRAPVFCL